MKPNTPHDFERSDLFGGKGTVQIWNLLRTHAPPFAASLWCSLEGHGSVGPHKQQECPEIIICLSGSGEIGVNRIQHKFEPGTQVYLPLGSVLSINNASEDNLMYLIIKAKKV